MQQREALESRRLDQQERVQVKEIVRKDNCNHKGKTTRREEGGNNCSNCSF